jgi:hypothetical protein
MDEYTGNPHCRVPRLTKVKNCATKREAEDCLLYLRAEALNVGTYPGRDKRNEKDRTPSYVIVKKGQDLYACFRALPTGNNQYSIRAFHRAEALDWLGKALERRNRDIYHLLSWRDPDDEPSIPFFVKCDAPDDRPEHPRGSPHAYELYTEMGLPESAVYVHTARFMDRARKIYGDDSDSDDDVPEDNTPGDSE